MTTLESFVVTPATRFAHAVVVAVIEAPGDAYNPVVLYGGRGSGKTHLLEAIAAGVPDREVLLMTAVELGVVVRSAPARLDDPDVVLVDEVEDATTFASIREPLTQVVRSGRRVVVATRGDERSFGELWSWGAEHEYALAADCWPLVASAA